VRCMEGLGQQCLEFRFRSAMISAANSRVIAFRVHSHRMANHGILDALEHEGRPSATIHSNLVVIRTNGIWRLLAVMNTVAAVSTCSNSTNRVGDPDNADRASLIAAPEQRVPGLLQSTRSVDALSAIEAIAPKAIEGLVSHDVYQVVLALTAAPTVR